jgi:hypothetical protein
MQFSTLLSIAKKVILKNAKNTFLVQKLPFKIVTDANIVNSGTSFNSKIKL